MNGCIAIGSLKKAGVELASGLDKLFGKVDGDVVAGAVVVEVVAVVAPSISMNWKWSPG